jgi:hypothetical protein
LAEAAELTANYRNAQPNDCIKAEFFGKNAILALLNQDNCMGMRIYYGQDNNGEKKLVLVGVDSSGNDLISGIIMEHGLLCPINCSSPNALNT